jgi:predicted RNA-binding Zn-ribbon protein involved in translation (DUF1610 family)
MEIEKYSARWLLNEIRNTNSDTVALFKILEFKKAITEQCTIANIVEQSEQLPNKYCPQCGEPIGQKHKFWCKERS